ncbi:MAG: Ig-like domain-containing protein [Rhodanobacteraceae bacterium]
MQLRNLFALIALSLLLTACGSSGSSSIGNNPPPTPAIVANFDPANSVIPFPNNLLFSGTTDLTLNIPVANPADFSDPQVALNALDGFSTVAPWSTGFSAAPSATSLSPGNDVHVYEVTLDGPGGKVTGITRELSSPQEYVVAMAPSDADGKTLAIVPTSPLKPRTSYMAVLTNGITDGNGKPVTASLTYTLAKGAGALCVDGKSTSESLTDAQACALEPVRQLVNSQEAAAAGAGVSRADIVLSWVATTQSTNTVLNAVASKIEGAPAATTQLAPTGKTLGDLGLGLAPIADVYIGYINLPYYLGVPSQSDPTAPLTDFWHAAPGAYVPPASSFGLDPTSTNVTAYNPFPVANQSLGAPLLVTVPNTGTRPAGGWPVVIFQHGITRNRTDMLAVAQTYASLGYAVVAMDLPLHGVDSSNPFYIGNTPFAAAAQERTFNLDVMNNDTGAPGPDGKVDPSGSHFINLQSLLTSRDNLREGVADLVELEHSIGSMALPDKPGTAFNASDISYTGQSLGSIVGTVFMAVDPNVQTAVLNVPGGGIARLLDASVSIGPQIHAGLAQAGVEQGTPAYDQFMLAAQTAVDSSDPINFARFTTGKNLLLQEVVGSDSSPSDQVIPNSVPGAPLSGTEPLIAALGLTAIDSSTQSATGVRAATRFTSGEHGSLLSPAADPAVTAEMQGEMASLIGSGGAAVQVANPAVLKPVE